MTKRYHHKRYTFQAWDTVVRELQEKRTRILELDTPANRGIVTAVDREAHAIILAQLQTLVTSLQTEWSNGAHAS